MPWQEDLCRKVAGSNPSTGKGFFSHEIHVKVYLYYFLAVEFVYNISVCCIMDHFYCVYKWQLFPE